MHILDRITTHIALVHDYGRCALTALFAEEGFIQDEELSGEESITGGTWLFLSL
ncbi:hypothetical protein [Solemya velum gill symbiont]|uniref:Uncharacterized protein n=1 Tax=Solemya velum gill symbiont TaxID=2340 RepID=A0A0B0HC97_SOVGS|nr:hypothetical protein [Solemya velum gill symbiont]KHF25066.1 hypothetical protein JV46_09390 [Solemya velum gill symbiont]